MLIASFRPAASSHRKLPFPLLPRVLRRRGVHNDWWTQTNDLRLMPQSYAPLSLSEAWSAMEQLQREGLTKSIGVSNFREQDFQEIQDTWTVPPAVNQVSHSWFLYLVFRQRQG